MGVRVGVRVRVRVRVGVRVRVWARSISETCSGSLRPKYQKRLGLGMVGSG